MIIQAIPYPASAAGPSTQWRLFFPDGAVNGAELAIREVQMFDDDASTTDLCSGGSASASHSGGTTTASDAFDDSQSTFWDCGTTFDDNSWLQYTFAAPNTVKSFTIQPHLVDTGYLPASVKLQSYNGATWSDVLSYASPIAMPVSVSRFYSDGSIEAEYVSSTSTTASTSSFAAKGTIVDVLKTCTIPYVKLTINGTAGETYKVVAALVSTSTGQITSILGTTPQQAASSTATYTFTFATPPSVTAGQRLAIIVVRTDGTSTSPCHVNFPSGGATGAVLTYYGSTRYASVNPAVGDSVVFDTANVVAMRIDRRFTP
jgi:hypothetical protein